VRGTLFPPLLLFLFLRGGAGQGLPCLSLLTTTTAASAEARRKGRSTQKTKTIGSGMRERKATRTVIKAKRHFTLMSKLACVKTVPAALLVHRNSLISQDENIL
jgi:hypothetical protein